MDRFFRHEGDAFASRFHEIKDTAVFRTSPKLNNVILDVDEFFSKGNVDLVFESSEQKRQFGCVTRT